MLKNALCFKKSLLLKNSLKIALCSSALWFNGAFASWTLQSEESSMHFVSIKSQTIAELHTFPQLTGAIADSGEFTLTIDLAKVETNIPIRNERMNEFLFETPKFPVATGKGKLDMAALKGLKAGEVKTIVVPVTIDLHGKTATKDVRFKVSKILENKVSAITAEPFFINASEFALTDGIEKLRELAGLPNIAQAVPVTASLVFVADPAKK